MEGEGDEGDEGTPKEEDARALRKRQFREEVHEQDTKIKESILMSSKLIKELKNVNEERGSYLKMGRYTLDPHIDPTILSKLLDPDLRDSNLTFKKVQELDKGTLERPSGM